MKKEEKKFFNFRSIVQSFTLGLGHLNSSWNSVVGDPNKNKTEKVYSNKIVFLGLDKKYYFIN